MALTHLAIEKLKPKDKIYRIADSGGLCLEVTPAGGKLWRWRYTYRGKAQMLALGKFPHTSLLEARKLRDEARALKETGKHPTHARNAQKLKLANEGENTFEIIARRWLEEKGARLNKKYHTQSVIRMEQHVFPHIGALPITDITIPDVVRVIDKMAQKGTHETAKRMGQIIGQTFRYASRRGLCSQNPAADLRDVLPGVEKRHHPCISPSEFPELLKAIHTYKGDVLTTAAMKLMALTFVRTRELIEARWEEIDWDREEWHIQEIVDASNCFDPSDPNDPQYLIEKAVTDNPGKVYFPSQFTNRKNPDFHEQTTAQEILNDLGPIDYFFGGLGTTGSSLGITARMRTASPDFKSIGVTAEHNHFIPGIRSLSQMMESELFRKDLYDTIVPLTEMEALKGVLMLSRKCGVLCGPSSGANFQAALQRLQAVDAQQTSRKKAVFIVCDRLEWYISYIRERMPELFGEKEKKSGFYGFNSDPIDIVPRIRAADIENWKADNPHHVIIDTRGKQSFDLLHVAGSINMPQEIFEKWIDNNRPFDADTCVLLICAVGERSRHYAAYLNHAGTKAFNLEGGIMAWSDLKNAA